MNQQEDHQKRNAPLLQRCPEHQEEGVNAVTFKSSIELELEPPREISNRSYSLTPDMVGGWKPKKVTKVFNKPPFQIRYEDPNSDLIVKAFLKNPNNYAEQLLYLGSRKTSSFSIHQNLPYPNPYGKSVKKQSKPWQKVNIRQNVSLSQSFLTFDSEFESGNLDMVLQTNEREFDLYMRVDTNTQGHTHWYNFQVRNEGFKGKVRFNICNFKRQESLYQKGMRPFVRSKRQGEIWKQDGTSVSYQKLKRNYSFLREGGGLYAMQGKYFSLSFTYQFKQGHDQVRFSYCVPYPYSKLLSLVNRLQNVQKLKPLKSLSGLEGPILKIGDQSGTSLNKKVIMMTARVHPGQSNSSYVMQGFLQSLCGDSSVGQQLRKKYIFYVIPMLNPDGVVAGNYRTSLFGKDLNRTFNQERRFAFPQTYYLVDFAKKLKQKYKKRFCLYIDLHGHSSKKNSFMYGPEYSIQSNNYQLCRQLPKNMGNLTPYFRYFACSFRIASSKTSTSRAIFSKILDIPFSYTMENSNGLYINHLNHEQVEGGIITWKETGAMICRAFLDLQIEKIVKIRRIFTEKIKTKATLTIEEPILSVEGQNCEEGESDCDSEGQDLPEQFLRQLQCGLSDGKIKYLPMKLINEKIDKTKQTFLEEKNMEIQLTLPKHLSCSIKKNTPKIQRSYGSSKQKLNLRMKTDNLTEQMNFLPPINPFKASNYQKLQLSRSRTKGKESSCSQKGSSKRYEESIIQACQKEKKNISSVIIIGELGAGLTIGLQSMERKPQNRAMNSLIQRLKTIK